AFRGHLLPGHHAAEHGGRLVADPLGVDLHRSQRRAGEIAKDLIVVYADNGHLIGYMNVCPPAGIENLLAAVVVASHYSDRFRQADQPGRYLLLLLFPARLRLLLLSENMTRKTARLDHVAKEPAAKIHPAITSERIAAKPKRLESAVQ